MHDCRIPLSSASKIIKLDASAPAQHLPTYKQYGWSLLPVPQEKAQQLLLGPEMVRYITHDAETALAGAAVCSSTAAHLLCQRYSTVQTVELPRTAFARDSTWFMLPLPGGNSQAILVEARWCRQQPGCYHPNICTASCMQRCRWTTVVLDAATCSSPRQKRGEAKRLLGQTAANTSPALCSYLNITYCNPITRPWSRAWSPGMAGDCS